jgi:hypothetical protein
MEKLNSATYHMIGMNDPFITTNSFKLINKTLKIYGVYKTVHWNKPQTKEVNSTLLYEDWQVLPIPVPFGPIRD